MEKQISVVAYWLGLTCTALAVIFRVCVALGVSLPQLGTTGAVPMSYVGFLHSSVLFFLLSIASWCWTEKS